MPAKKPATKKTAKKNKAVKKAVKKTPAKTTNKRGDARGMNPASQSNLKPYEPGQSGNPDGWPRGKRHPATLARLAFDKLSMAVLEKVNARRKADKLTPLTLEESGVDAELDMWVAQCEKARKGDTKAFEVVNAYLHGKPTQNVNHGGQPDNPIVHEHEIAETEAEIEEWLEGWFNPTSHKKVTVKKAEKENANSTTDNGGD